MKNDMAAKDATFAFERSQLMELEDESSST